MKYIIFDTETTSLKPGQIGQLTYAILDMETRRAKGKNFYFKVDSMDKSAEYIHHLSKEKLEKLSNGLVFADKADEIYEDFVGNLMVGHNVSFDIRFLSHELAKQQMYFLTPQSFCTMAHFKDIMKMSKKGNGYKNPKLEELVQFMGITTNDIEDFANKLFGGFSGYHDARYDVSATALVFIRGFQKGYIREVA